MRFTIRDNLCRIRGTRSDTLHKGMTGLEPILNPLWVALFYGERISSLAMVGAVIVVGGIVLYQVSMAKGSNDRNRKETLL